MFQVLNNNVRQPYRPDHQSWVRCVVPFLTDGSVHRLETLTTTSSYLSLLAIRDPKTSVKRSLKYTPQWPTR